MEDIKMNDLKIRQGRTQDIDEISALYDTVTEYLESHTNYPGWKKGIYPARIHGEQGIKEGTLYAAWLDGKLAGSIILNQDQENGYDSVTWKTEAKPDEVTVVHTLLVHPDYLKAGVGKALLEFAERKAGEEGKKTIRLDVYENNGPAIGLYERVGYEYAGTADLGYKDIGLNGFKLYEKPLKGKE